MPVLQCSFIFYFLVGREGSKGKKALDTNNFEKTKNFKVFYPGSLTPYQN